MAKPQVCVIVSTYERPHNLRLVLASLAAQRDVAGMEVIVADDGSRDETPEVVKQFRREADFPVRFVTHAHRGFCPGKSRNEGATASQAEYLLFLDGDCLIPPDHVKIHLERKRRGVVWLGECAWLPQAVSEQVTEDMVRSGEFQSLATARQKRSLWWKACKSRWYNLTRHGRKPALLAGNVGMWRDDYFRVNGFDENYVGWGCEDDDFGLRLRRAGLNLQSILFWTHTYHLWHAPAPSAPKRWRQGANVNYLERRFHLTRCGNGIAKRSPQDVDVRLVGKVASPKLVRSVMPSGCHYRPHDASRPAEVEVMFAPSKTSFSGRADCNVLVVPDASTDFAPQYAQAHLVLSDHPWSYVSADHQFGLNQFEAALEFLLTNERPQVAARRAAA